MRSEDTVAHFFRHGARIRRYRRTRSNIAAKKMLKINPATLAAMACGTGAVKYVAAATHRPSTNQGTKKMVRVNPTRILRMIPKGRCDSRHVKPAARGS